MRRETLQRTFALGALAVAAVVVAALLLGGSGSYTVHARFLDAGQLVKGDLVEVSGRGIGTIKEITLTEDNQADVRMEITEDRYKPLRRGTHGTIRAVGLSGVANRFVELTPGPTTGDEVPDGGVLTTAETTPIVDLDQLLNALGPEERKDLQGVIRHSADVFDGVTAETNRTLQFLSPTVFQGAALADELARDRVAVERLIQTGATTATALASRSGDLEEGVTASATTLEAIARERIALQDTLSRAPVVLRQAQGTLARTRGTIEELRPTLRELEPVAPKLAQVLRQLVPTGQRARPVLADLRAILPKLRETLALGPALEKVAIPAGASTLTAVQRALPIFAGLRPYAPDVVQGITTNFVGSAAQSYDANGHYARILPMLGQLGLSGSLAPLAPPDQVLGQYTGKDARCPGAAVEPASDKSNPYIPDPSLCDPADSQNARRRK